MIKRTKTKNNLIIILSGILVTVFVCIMGFTFASSGLMYQYTSRPNPTVYAANQQVKVVNDTLVTPIPFGLTGQGYEISIQYSVGYDFDLRLRYSMSWTGEDENGDPLTTDNVILSFANRDDYIVDNSYIYKAKKIDKGSGKLTIITGVDFVDVTDTRYVGETLTIQVNAEFYKTNAIATPYNNEHPLYQADSIAAVAWLKHRNLSIADDTAHAIVYNYHYDVAHGMDYPETHIGAAGAVGTEMGAYRKTLNATNSSVVDSVDWLAGNRSYGGVGLYIVTGNTPMRLTARVSGVWVWNNPDATQGTDLAYENNIQYNHAMNNAGVGWVHDSWDDSLLYRNVYFNKIIPENSTFYIEVVDSLEITSVAMPTSDYEYYTIVTNSVNINGTTFLGQIDDGIINNVTDNTNLNKLSEDNENDKYKIQNVTAVNTSKYANLMADSQNLDSQTFHTNVTLVNNSSNYMSISGLTYQLKYRLSNGFNGVGFDTNNDSTPDTRAENMTGMTNKDLFNNTAGAYYCASGTLELYTGTNAEGSKANDALEEYILAPYASVNVLAELSTNANLAETVAGEWRDDANKKYDLLVEIVVSYTATKITSPTASQASNVSVETKVNDSNVEFYLKNNTNYTLTSPSAIVIAYTLTPAYTWLETMPTDWDYGYWKYYQKNSGVYTPITTKPDNYPNNVYMLTTSKTTVLNSIALTTGTLLPNESKMVRSESVSLSNSKLVVQIKSVSGSGATETGIKLINDGTNNAMIVNFSNNSYYVRFQGAYVGTYDIATSTYIKDNTIKTIGSNNYFIGVMRPGQILDVSMSAAGSGLNEVEYVPNQDYTTTISGWLEAHSEYNNYFN